MHQKFTERLEAGLKKMQAAAESGRLKDVAKAHEQLGRLKEKNWRASHVFDVSVKKLPTPRGKQHLEITFQPNAKFAAWNELSAGCYLLRSNLTDIDAATLLASNHGAKAVVGIGGVGGLEDLERIYRVMTEGRPE